MPASATPSSQRQLHGTVVGFNLGPKGQVEGALVESEAGLEQVNFPKHAAETFSRSMAVGSKIHLDVVLETDATDHRVYRICDDEAQASGKIVRLNYALHGVINGYHLDDATFLHVKPRVAEKYNLHVGQTVRARGIRREGPDAVVLEVRTIEKLERLGKRHDDVVPV